MIYSVMKQKYLFSFFLLILLALPLYAQNKIGNNPAKINGGSLLELESTSKGLLLPRIQLDDMTKWTIDGTPVNGMMIFNETGLEPKGIYYWSTDSLRWLRSVNKSELSTLIANYINQNTTVRDSIIKVINNTITTGGIDGKDLTSNSAVLTVLNGTGAVINAVQVDLDKNAFGHLLLTSPVSDSLSIAISKNTVIRDSINSVVKATTTNTLTGESDKLTSIVNGVSADLVPASGTINKTLGFDTNGKLVIQAPTSTSTVVSNTSTVNSISTTVNGSTGVAVNIINNNSLSLVNGVLSSSVNGVMSSPGLNLVSSADNGLTSKNGNVQLGGTLIKPTTLSTTAINTLSITGLQNGNMSTDSILVVAPNTGRVGKISGDMLGTNMYKLIAFATSNGQKRFETPAAITQVKKIQVYRNGINVEFTKVDDTHIDLEDQAACYVDDEVKIIQLK